MEQEQDSSRKGQDWGSALICLVHLGQPPPLSVEASHMLMGMLVESGSGAHSAPLGRCESCQRYQDWKLLTF